MKLKFGVLIIGAVVVLFIGLRFFLSKSKNNNFNNLTFENSGVNLENKENQRIVRGEVTSWDWKKGRLMLWSGNKNLEIMVEPAKMMVFTANPTKNTDMLPLLAPVLRSTPAPQAVVGRPSAPSDRQVSHDTPARWRRLRSPWSCVAPRRWRCMWADRARGLYFFPSKVCSMVFEE